jgi:hypothetical protein
MKGHASWTATEVRHYNRLCFIIDHIVEKVDGNMDRVRVTLQQMDDEKGGANLSTVYTRFKNIIKVEPPLKY